MVILHSKHASTSCVFDKEMNRESGRPTRARKLYKVGIRCTLRAGGVGSTLWAAAVAVALRNRECRIDKPCFTYLYLLTGAP